MKVKIKFSLVLFLALVLLGFKSAAQDEQPSQEELNQQHPELNLNEDKTLLMEADVKTSKGQPTTRETNSPAIIPAKGKPDNSKPSSGEKTDEDPLSFNFLYFIIQKFKISDIVDD